MDSCSSRRAPCAVRPALLIALLTAATAVASLNRAVSRPAIQQPDPPPVVALPGLIATYTSGASASNSGGAAIIRVEAAPALALQPQQSPHPAMNPAFVARWEGFLEVVQPGQYAFSIEGVGSVRLAVEGRDVLRAGVDGEATSDALALNAGRHAIEVQYTRPGAERDAGGPLGVAQLLVFWESPDFGREPIPAGALSHHPEQETAELRLQRQIELGRFLAEEFNCLACHRPDEEDRLAASLAERPAPDLSTIGARAYPAWIHRWLGDPQAARPEALMPHVFADDAAGNAERYAVAAVLATFGGPLAPPTQYPEPDERAVSMDRGRELFTRTGCIVCHGPAGESQARGEVDRPAERGGDAAPPLVTLGDLTAKTTPERLQQFLEDPLQTRPSGRMPNMRLTRDEARDLARYVCRPWESRIEHALPDPPPDDALLAAFRALGSSPEELAAFQQSDARTRTVQLGRRVLAARGCANCHRIAPPNSEPIAAAPATSDLQAIRSAVRQADEQGARLGCLDPQHALQQGAPRFPYGGEQIAALHAFLVHTDRAPAWEAPAYAADVAIRRFQCTRCHARNEGTGLREDVIAELRSVETVETTEAISPPPLTAAGHRLRSSWMHAVMLEGRRARPWMGLRMPQFGSENLTGIPEGIAALDGRFPAEQPDQLPFDPEMVEAGRQLVGRSGPAGGSGFGCIACHDIAGIASGGTRGPDLAEMQDRVRLEWYRRWMADPQRIQPGTRMPTVFTDGTSPLPILGRDPARQTDAIWQYLSLGESLPLPEGLEPPPGVVLVPESEPLAVRTFMPDAGTRAFAIGFPGGISAAWDAERCRLAYGWSGNFVDLSPVWGNRGGAPANVLGPRFWTAPAGFPWAFTESRDERRGTRAQAGGETSEGETIPDPIVAAADPTLGAPLPEGQLPERPRRLHFRGYYTDSDAPPVRHSPTFTYEVTLEREPGDGGDSPPDEDRPSDSPPYEGRIGGGSVRLAERLAPLESPGGIGLRQSFQLTAREGVVAWLTAGETTGEVRVLGGGGDARNGEAREGGTARRVVAPAEPQRAARHAAADGLLVFTQPDGRLAALAARQVPDGSEWVLRPSQGRTFILLRVPPARQERPPFGQCPPPEDEPRTIVLDRWAPYRDEPAVLQSLRDRN